MINIFCVSQWFYYTLRQLVPCITIYLTASFKLLVTFCEWVNTLRVLRSFIGTYKHMSNLFYANCLLSSDKNQWNDSSFLWNQAFFVQTQAFFVLSQFMLSNNNHKEDCIYFSTMVVRNISDCFHLFLWIKLTNDMRFISNDMQRICCKYHLGAWITWFKILLWCMVL